MNRVKTKQHLLRIILNDKILIKHLQLKKKLFAFGLFEGFFIPLIVGSNRRTAFNFKTVEPFDYTATQTTLFWLGPTDLNRNKMHFYFEGKVNNAACCRNANKTCTVYCLFEWFPFNIRQNPIHFFLSLHCLVNIYIWREYVWVSEWVEFVPVIYCCFASDHTKLCEGTIVGICPLTIDNLQYFDFLSNVNASGWQ